MFESLYSNTPIKTTPKVSSGGSFNTLFTSTPKTPKVTPKVTPKKIVKPTVTPTKTPQATNTGVFGNLFQSLVQKVTKTPIVGQVINFAKQTAIDLKTAITTPIKQTSAYIKAQLNEKDRKELDKINKSKISQEEKINKANKLLEKYGGLKEGEFKSSERGAELVFLSTKAGGIPEMGAVEGNLKYIFKQGLGKLTGKGEAIAKIVGKESKPQEIINTVFQNNLEKTTEGKGLLKTATQAQKQGKNVVIEAKSTTPLSVKKAVGESGGVKAGDVNAGFYDTKPIYHGTPEKFSKFDTNRSEGGASWFTADKGEILSGKAGAVQGAGQKLNIMERYPKANLKLATPEQADKLYTDQLIAEGYRGVKYPASKGQAEWTKLWFPNEDTVTKLPRVAQPTIGEVKPKVGVPKVEGKTPSKIAVSIERKAIEDKLTKGFEGVAGYDKITIKDQAERAFKTMQNIDEARAIIRGEKPLPSGLRGTSLITAMEEQIKKTGDSKLAYELANSPLVSETSAAAQEMRLAAERQADSLTAKLREVKQAREEAFKKRFGDKKIAEVQKKVVSDIKSKVKVASKYDWSNFIKSLPTC